MPPSLPNPVWSALRTEHRRFAVGTAALCRYPADVAPFAAVAHAGALPEAAAAILRRDDGPVYFIGEQPTCPAGFVAESLPPVIQMLCVGPPRPVGAALDVRELGEDDVDQMVALTERVYPSHFRRRTSALGRYVGLFEGNALVAMGGERLAPTGYRELSAICTDPAFTGRGFARAILASLVERIRAHDLAAFLHVSATNTRARELYASAGFVDVAELPLMRVTAEL